MSGTTASGWTHPALEVVVLQSPPSLQPIALGGVLVRDKQAVAGGCGSRRRWGGGEEGVCVRDGVEEGWRGGGCV